MENFESIDEAGLSEVCWRRLQFISSEVLAFKIEDRKLENVLSINPEFITHCANLNHPWILVHNSNHFESHCGWDSDLI